jgi:hypothetical protein
MGNTQIIDGKGYRIRHIEPGTGEGSTITLLGKTYGFTELPLSHLPDSADLVEGSYSRRLGDSGEFTLTFPNAAGSKGLWRERFSSDYGNEFIEIYRDDVLEFVGYIDRVDIDAGRVQISGKDAWSLLRFAYETDRSWTAAPQEVIDAYTRVPVTKIADDFTTTLDPAWSAHGVGVSLAQSGSKVRVTQTAGTIVGGMKRAVTLSEQEWEVEASYIGMSPSYGILGILLYDSGGIPGTPVLYITWDGNDVTFSDALVGSNLLLTGASPAEQLPVTLKIVRKGRWAYGYANGRLVGVIASPTVDIEHILFQAVGNVSGTGYVDIDQVVATEKQPFLRRGSTVGKYVLPTDLAVGGLRGRYWNESDLAGVSTSERYRQIMTPTRQPYAERLDSIIDTSAGLSLPVQPGAGADYFSVRWFGAVYLRLDQGNYTFEITSLDDGARLWVGKTAWGDQLIDSWVAGSGTVTGTLTASTLGSEAGWYPIILEYFEDAGAATLQLKFTPPAGGYTDPGGTSIAASTKIVIPSTSLSPLGCYDNHIQNQPFFDITTDAAQQFGYQMECSPMQLESGEFPGRVVPQIRVGSDTSVILTSDIDDRGEPIMQAGYTLDSSEQVTILKGQGSGQADGSGSQVTSAVYDIDGMSNALFAREAQISAADIDFADLLGARLNAELALRATPWEELRGTPRGQEQLADTWPLSDTLSAMRWRPGDGIRVNLDEIGLVDLEPRQITQVTRNFAAEGRTGTTVSFRQRPRSAVRSLRSTIQAALKHTRNYQGQRVPIWGNYVESTVLAGGNFSGYCYIPLNGGDKVVHAELRIVVNNGAMPLGVEINGTTRTTDLQGTWLTPPITVDITAYARPASTSDPRLYIRMINTGGSNSNVQFNAFVEVVR